MQKTERVGHNKNTETKLMKTQKDQLIKKLHSIGLYVFVNILYPAIKNNPDIDLEEICRLYPEYAKRAKSEITKKTRLSSSKSIILNGMEEEALMYISASNKLDDKSINKALKYLYALNKAKKQSI